jgi:hypothetical protein
VAREFCSLSHCSTQCDNIRFILTLSGLLITGVYCVLAAQRCTIMQTDLERKWGLFVETGKHTLIGIRFVATPVPMLLEYHDATAPSGPRPLHFWGFIITLRHTTLDRTPLDEWSARRREFYLTTHKNQKRQTSMTPDGLEHTIWASEQLQTHALNRAATEISPVHI